ncbi:hypothetical protein FACS1894176_05090 [Bacteroidia bacterium]|nr:hypothetical protein FACS1894176_05090 [Bacteroidia bacterium]
MEYNYQEKKVVIVLYEKVEMGIALNICGHLSLALGALIGKDILGRVEHLDASGIKHAGISKYPVIITKTSLGKLRNTIHEARDNQAITLIDYPKEMLETGHDDELNDAISSKAEDQFEYFGAIFYGESSEISTITGKFSLWR